MHMLNEKYQAVLTNKDRAKEITAEILDAGHIELKDFLSPEAWQQLSDFASKRREEVLAQVDGGQTLGKGNELEGTFGQTFGHSEEVLAFCQMVHNARCELEGKTPTTLDPAKQSIGFPYKDARNGASTIATPYHFDGAYINILIPIILPDDQEKSGGSLTVFPNIRKKYGTFLSKFICRGLRTSALLRKMLGAQTVVYSVGSAHVFFGDISFHGVEPIKDGERLVMTINAHW